MTLRGQSFAVDFLFPLPGGMLWLGRVGMAAIVRKHPIWGRLIGWFAAYLLVFHVALASASTGHFFAASNGIDSVLCLNGGQGQSSPTELPAGHSGGKIHCVLCAGGGSLVIASVEICLVPELNSLSVLVPVSDQVFGPRRNHSPSQSRAPPFLI
jgi:hypothetical protein